MIVWLKYQVLVVFFRFFPEISKDFTNGASSNKQISFLVDFEYCAHVSIVVEVVIGLILKDTILFFDLLLVL